jgi:hypothetical protein
MKKMVCKQRDRAERVRESQRESAAVGSLEHICNVDAGAQGKKPSYEEYPINFWLGLDKKVGSTEIQFSD